MKHKYFIDAHKGLTLLVVLGLIAYYSAWQDARAWLYLGIHGSYGILWLIKSKAFPDSQWEKPVPLLMGVSTWLGLGLYWVGPWLIVTQRTAVPPSWLLGGAVFIYGLGVLLHFASDMQKYMSLKLRPGVLLTDGLWSRLRSPNYLGELLIYLSFCMVVYHLWPLLILACFVFGYWIPNILKKDRSLSRYPEFAAWKARSWRLIPFVF